MSKLQLPTVTLMCVDCVNVTRAINVIEKCKALCDFGDVKLLTSIQTDHPNAVKIAPLTSLVAYSVFMLTDSYKYFNTSHVLVVQGDGWILNPSSWKNEWLQYDYMGPLFIQYDTVGSGGFSLRSKEIMTKAAQTLPAWDGSDSELDRIQSIIGCYEDGYLAMALRSTHSTFKYPSLAEAADFAQGGNPNPEYHRPNPFGYHGAWQNIDHETGQVSPICEHAITGNHCSSCTADHLSYMGSMAESLKKFN